MAGFGRLIRGALSNALDRFLGGAGSDISIKIGSVTLPVLPESFNVQVAQKNGTVTINNAGEYSMIGKTGLKSVTISSFFPAQDYTFAQSVEPYEYVDKIEAMRTGGKAVTFTIDSTSISFDVLIDSFEYGEKDGTGDVYYTVNLREYRLPEVVPPKLDETTGLKKQKLSYLQRTGLNMAKRVLRGESPIHAISGALGEGGLDSKQQGYLTAFKCVAKQGGLQPGDLIQFMGDKIKVNDKTISIK